MKTTAGVVLLGVSGGFGGLDRANRVDFRRNRDLEPPQQLGRRPAYLGGLPDFRPRSFVLDDLDCLERRRDVP